MDPAEDSEIYMDADMIYGSGDMDLSEYPQTQRC